MGFEKGNDSVLNLATIDEEFFVSISDGKLDDTVDSVVVQEAML